MERIIVILRVGAKVTSNLGTSLSWASGIVNSLTAIYRYSSLASSVLKR